MRAPDIIRVFARFLPEHVRDGRSAGLWETQHVRAPAAVRARTLIRVFSRCPPMLAGDAHSAKLRVAQRVHAPAAVALR